MPSPRPIIGVTGPDAGGAAAWLAARLGVALAGGHAVRITPRRPRAIDALDGLIIGGGADVDPQLYGDHEPDMVPRARPIDEPRLLHAMAVVVAPLTWLARKLVGGFVKPGRAHGGRDPRRDALELGLLDAALRCGLPVLGICRGEQLINVHFGGTLARDLRSFYTEDPAVRSILPRKRVVVEPGTRLAAVLGPRPRRVNALHDHAIDRLGRGLRVAARDRNGIVQAIEHATLSFVVGVQWHPEYLPQIPEQRALFRALVGHAGHRALHKGGTGVPPVYSPPDADTGGTLLCSNDP